MDIMKCVHIKCGNRAIDDERFLSCFMCGCLAHIKCIGVSGLVMDACLAKVGIRWYCHECDTVVLDFKKLRKAALENLSSLEKELSVAQKKVAESTKALKSYSVAKTSSGKEKEKKRPANIVLQKACLPEPSSVPLLKTPEIIPLLDSPEKTVSEPVRIEAASGTSKRRSIFDISMSDDASTPKPLVAVSPKKKRRTIFVSRLASKSSETDVCHYIKSKVKADNGINVKKFQFSYPRLIASFKITVPDILFEEIVSETFWPPNTLVREFEYKPNSSAPRIAELPVSKSVISSGVSKN